MAVPHIPVGQRNSRSAGRLSGFCTEPTLKRYCSVVPPTMNVATILSPWRVGDAASSMRNNDQGPWRSSTEGSPAGVSCGDGGAPNAGLGGGCCGLWSGPTVMAVRLVPAPGHGTATGAVEPVLLSTMVPLMSSFAVMPPAVAGGGTTPRLIDGMLPPVEENASPICAARWDSRSVAGDSVRASALSWRQVHSRCDVSTSAVRFWVKNLSMVPPGPNSLPNSASGTSCALPPVKGYWFGTISWHQPCARSRKTRETH